MKLALILLSVLAVSLSHARDFRVGDRIIDQWGNPGVVSELYSSQKAKVTLDPQDYVREISFLGKGYRCMEDVCVGRKVIDQWNNEGTIVEIFDNGMVRLKHSLGGAIYTRRLAELGISLDCLRDMSCRCHNDPNPR